MILKALSVPSPYVVILPVRTGIFSMARKKFDPTHCGFSQDTVLLLSAICKHIGVSDVFVEPSVLDEIGENALEMLLVWFDERELEKVGTEAWDGDAKTEDHVLQALLLTVSLQFSQLPTTARIRCTSREGRVQRLQHHVARNQINNYWRPLPGCLLWCLFVGINNSRDLPQNGFFMSNFIRAACGIGYGQSEVVRISLATFYKIQ